MILELLNSIINKKRKINIKELPSQGLFHSKDFSLSIKRASEEDINHYIKHIDNKSISVIINLIKYVVKNNTTLPKGYYFCDIKSIDIIYIFLEIVKYTTNRPIFIKSKDYIIEFDSKNFVYFFDKNKDILNFYNKENRNFYMDGYHFTLPSIGVEDSLTNYLIKKIDIDNETIYSEYYYDFTYFLGNKNKLDLEEIENLIQIFNYDLDTEESKKIKKIVELFIPIQKYKLIYNNQTVDLTSKVDLVKIWN